MIKRVLTGLCTVILLLTACVSFAEEAEVPGKYDELVVGTPTAFNGNFFSDAFGTNASDQDVQRLLHGYNLVRWDSDGGVFVFDESVTSGVTVRDDLNGNRTYTIVLASDLVYSDGTPVTAKDYVFSFLLSTSEVLEEIGGTVLHAGYIAGFEEYRTGQTNILRGIRLLNDHMFSVTISADYRPFFYETGLLNVAPYPMSVIAPDADVKDYGEGITLIGSPDAETLTRTLLDPENGYITHPSVTSGPYKLTAFDGTEVTLEINENYKGNYLGNKPSIPKLIYRYADNDTLMAAVENGEIDLANKIVRSDMIDNGIQMVSSGTVNMTSYARSGCSFISFCCERPTVSDPAVRKAIAMCLDKEQLTEKYTGNYGMTVNGFYGLGQWMYQVMNGTKTIEFETEEETEAFEKAISSQSLETLPSYDPDPQGAAAMLESAGWKLNADGIRSKTVNGEETALTLEMLYPEGNVIGDYITEIAGPQMKEIGIELTAIAVPFDRLTDYYFGYETRECDMMFLATNFDLVYDPSQNFVPGREVSQLNPTGINDETLYELAVDLRQTEPGNTAAYCLKWVAFQKQLMEDLAVIPVYTNAYFDFYTPALMEYSVSEYTGWSSAIVNSYLSDFLPEEDMQFDDGEMIIE